MRFNPGYYEYDRRYDDTLGKGFKVAWTINIVSINGAHYHFWFPKCKGKELAEWKSESRYHASYQGDPVSFSYDWIPEGGDNGSDGVLRTGRQEAG